MLMSMPAGQGKINPFQQKLYSSCRILNMFINCGLFVIGRNSQRANHVRPLISNLLNITPLFRTKRPTDPQSENVNSLPTETSFGIKCQSTFLQPLSLPDTWTLSHGMLPKATSALDLSGGTTLILILPLIMSIQSSLLYENI